MDKMWKMTILLENKIWESYTSGNRYVLVAQIEELFNRHGDRITEIILRELKDNEDE